MLFSIILNQDAFRASITRQVRPLLMKIAEMERTEEIISFSLPKTGREYFRPRPPGGRYRASAPGEAPAIRTGALRRSEGTPRFIGPLTVSRTIGAPYARILEFQKGRPFVGPAIENVTRRFANNLKGRF